jgi:hypothetical protein
MAVRRVSTKNGTFPLCKSYQGEVNESTDHAYLSKSSHPDRRLVLRGSNVCMYVLRGAERVNDFDTAGFGI